MIYSNHEAADKVSESLRIVQEVNEAQRIEIERMHNVFRLISYNNRRIARGLEPLDYPPALTKCPIAYHLPSVHRDNIQLSKR